MHAGFDWQKLDDLWSVPAVCGWIDPALCETGSKGRLR